MRRSLALLLSKLRLFCTNTPQCACLPCRLAGVQQLPHSHVSIGTAETAALHPLVAALHSRQLPPGSVIFVTALDRITRWPGTLAPLHQAAMAAGVHVVVVMHRRGVLTALQQAAGDSAGRAAAALGSTLAGRLDAGLQMALDAALATSLGTADSEAGLALVALDGCADSVLDAMVAEEACAAAHAHGRAAAYGGRFAHGTRAAVKAAVEVAEEVMAGDAPNMAAALVAGMRAAYSSAGGGDLSLEVGCFAADGGGDGGAGYGSDDGGSDGGDDIDTSDSADDGGSDGGDDTDTSDTTDDWCSADDWRSSEEEEGEEDDEDEEAEDGARSAAPLTRRAGEGRRGSGSGAGGF